MRWASRYFAPSPANIRTPMSTPSVRRAAAGPQRFSELRPDLPAWIEAALARAVAIDPARRFRDMTEFALEFEAGPARAISAMQQPSTLYQRAPVQVWQGIAALLALALLVSLLTR